MFTPPRWHGRPPTGTAGTAGTAGINVGVINVVVDVVDVVGIVPIVVDDVEHHGNDDAGIKGAIAIAVAAGSVFTTTVPVKGLPFPPPH